MLSLKILSSFLYGIAKRGGDAMKSSHRTHRGSLRHNVLIPTNLIDKMKAFERNPPPICGFSISRMEYLIHLILLHKQDKHPGAYSLLNMQYMQFVVPQADEYLKFLREQNIIEWQNYCAGRNSRMYRLIIEGMTEFRTITDIKLINRIEKIRRKIRSRNSKKYPVLNHYIHMVKIDYDAAVETINSVYQKNVKEGKDNANGRRSYSLCEIERINNGDIYIKVSKTNGRLDSNFTRLPSELLQHLSINGKPLPELDTAGSQPFYAASLFNPTSEVELVMNKVLGHTLTMSVKSLQISEYEDVKLYTSLVMRGKLYKYLLEKFKEYGIYRKDIDELKKKLFIVFFGKPLAYLYNTDAIIFKEIFPNVQIMFDMIKNDEHNKLAILLQSIESYTMLESVAPKIISEFPGLPFITRHDSILPSISEDKVDINKIQMIMSEVIKKVTGLSPKIRLKGSKK